MFMSLLNKLFGKSTVDDSLNENQNIKSINNLDLFLKQLLSSDSYIAKSDYLRKIAASKDMISYFQQLKKDDLLSDYCKKNKVSYEKIISILQQYSDIKKLVNEHNETFISQKLESEKSYLDTILNDIDPIIRLDDDQRRVVLTDEDYCLVIAGAGAGKTTTVAAKVKYLVEKKVLNQRKFLLFHLQIRLLGN